MKKGTKNYKILVLTLIAAFLLSFVTGCSSSKQPNSSSQNDKGTIKIGYVNWAECVAVSNLWQLLLEEQGYKVKLIQLDVAPLYMGLNKGDIDLFLDAWLPITHATYWQEYQDSLEDYGIWYQESAKIGIVVPQYVTIDSISQLKDEASKFNNKIIGVDPGAGIMKASVQANKAYGLGYQVIQGSEPAMMAALDKAYGKKEWIAITGWSPHWMFAKYDLKYLADPKKEFGEAEQIHILANKDFSSKHTEVSAMLKSFKMTDAQIGTLEGFINEGMGPADAAKKWRDENKDVIESWIK